MPVCPESVRGKYFLVEINPSENFPIIKKMHKYDFIAITIVKRVLFPSQKATRITSTKSSKSINKNRFTICSTLISMNPVSSLMGTDTKSSMFDTHTQTHTKNRSEAFKYSSNPHIRFRLCSIVKHTPFSRWFHTARPRIGFSFDAFRCYSSFAVLFGCHAHTNTHIKTYHFRWLLNMPWICVYWIQCEFHYTRWSFSFQNHSKVVSCLFVTILNKCYILPKWCCDLDSWYLISHSLNENRREKKFRCDNNTTEM